MKGEIFALFEGFISENWGEDKYEEIYEKSYSDLDTKDPFLKPMTYPDSDFMKLFVCALEELSVAADVALVEFGKHCFPKLMEKVPDLVKGHNHPKTLLQIVDSIIHVEVKKIHKDAELPKFSYEDPAPEKLIMTYSSKRNLFHFVEGMILGSSEYYSVPLSIEKVATKVDNSDAMQFHITFEC